MSRETERSTGEPPPSVRAFRLEIVGGDGKGSHAVSRDGVLRVGASPGNDLVCPDRKVSSHHLELHATERGVFLDDLDSTNGTSIDGLQVTGAWLRGEARIKLGDTELWYSESGMSPGPPFSESTSFGAAIGVSLAMRRIFTVLERAAPTDATILLEGESGTGKEILARAIHDASPRKSEAFVIVDCGAAVATLLEAELFGHVRGAFTGATRSRSGLLESADGGTVFLDEIGEMPLELQTRLLRVLESRTIRRVGDSTDTKIDVRFIAATNRDLRRQVNERTFREDLFHRLAVVRVLVPPLRRRPEDIVPIARRIVASLSERYGADAPKIPDEDLVALARRRWSGNVRELRNTLERMVAMARTGDPSAAEWLSGTPVESTNPGIDLTGSFKDAKSRQTSIFERAYVTALLERHRGNLTAAAREADVSRMHLRNLARRYGVDVDELRDS